MRVCSAESDKTLNNRTSKANLAEYKANLNASEGHGTNSKMDLAYYKAAIGDNDRYRMTKADLARYNAKLNASHGDSDGYLTRAWRSKNCCTKVNFDWQQPNCCHNVTDFDCFKQYRERIRPTIGCVRPIKLQATENATTAPPITGREQLTVTGTAGTAGSAGSAGTGNLESNLEQHTGLGGGVTDLVSDLSCSIPRMTNTNIGGKTGKPTMAYWPSALPWMYKSHRQTEARSKYPLRPSPASRRRRACPPDPCTFGTIREVHDNIPTIPSVQIPTEPQPSATATVEPAVTAIPSAMAEPTATARPFITAEPSAPAFQPQHTVETFTLKIPKSQKDQIRARLAARQAASENESIREHVQVKETIAKVEVQETEQEPEGAPEADEVPIETDAAAEEAISVKVEEEEPAEEVIEKESQPAEEVMNEEAAQEEAVQEEALPDEGPVDEPPPPESQPEEILTAPEPKPVEGSQEAGTEPVIEAKTVYNPSQKTELELKPKRENIHVVVQILTPRQKKKSL